jgi:hypothetical protein
MNLELLNDINEFWINSKEYYSFQSNEKFLKYFFPENLNINLWCNASKNTDSKNTDVDGVVCGIQFEENEKLDENKLNILICVENCYHFKHYKHYNKYGNYGNNKIKIYFYNHIDKLELTDNYIAIPIIYIQINYFKYNYNNIKPAILLDFNKKRFCLIATTNSHRKETKNKIINELNKICRCDSINLYKSFIHDKSCYHSDELIKLFNCYKFVFICENSLGDGYITEKIFNCFFSRTIPIYNGSKKIEYYFNKNSFINSNDSNTKELIKKINLLNNNEELYNNVINYPKINNDYNDENYKVLLQEFINKKINNFIQ